jgi:hypothetical protein
LKFARNTCPKDDSMPYSILSHLALALDSMGLARPQTKFLLRLLPTWLAVRGRCNYLNLSRYGDFHERTLRRWFARDFAWAQLNQWLLAHLIPEEHHLMAALDASFVPKSGKRTPGLGWFFNGCAGRAERGLELSLVSVVDVTANTAYALSARQTPAPPAPAASTSTTPGAVQQQAGSSKAGKSTKSTKSSKSTKAGKRSKDQAAQATRLDAYLEHFTAVRPRLPATVRHLAVDGAFTTAKFVAGVCALELEVVGKLRRDADLRYLYHGPQQPRGRRRRYAGKVQWGALELRRWHSEGEWEPGVHRYSAALYHVRLKRVLRVALLQDGQSHKYVLLFSTDLALTGQDIVRLYQARYQIEFVFRDGKGALGLTDCQARGSKALEFHWNAALSALNLAKCQASERASAAASPRQLRPGATGPGATGSGTGTQRPVFSVVSCKQRHSNQHLLQLFSARLGLDWSVIKSHPAYTDLCNYGVIQS